MNIIDNIRNRFRSRRTILDYRTMAYGDVFEGRLKFARVVFYNMVDLVADLINDVTFVRIGGDTMLYAEFTTFVEIWGQVVLHRLFRYGFVVIGHDATGFRILVKDKDYRETSDADKSVVEQFSPDVDVFVMRSLSYIESGSSDYELLLPWLKFIDNVMNSSNTISARLGTLLVASPKNPSSAPTSLVLTKEQKDALEKEMQNDYGSLRKQKQVMLLPREMNMQVINLAGVDQRTMDKVKMGVLVIADHLKIPSNQVSIIDANSSKSLSNGSELREGDFNKYQTFERLLNRTFIQMAQMIGLKVDYTIYNKPTRDTSAAQ